MKKWLLASAFSLLAGAASAQFQPEREFQRVEPPRPVAAGGTEQVIYVVDHLVKLAREERAR